MLAAGAGDLPCELQCFIGQFFGGNYAVHQADAFGLDGRDGVARQQHLEGFLGVHGAGQGHGRGRAEQPDPYAGRSERGLGGGNHQVASGGQLASRRGGDALHLGDDKLRQPPDRFHHFAA